MLSPEAFQAAPEDTLPHLDSACIGVRGNGNQKHLSSVILVATELFNGGQK
jgi:hypothetical protein